MSLRDDLTVGDSGHLADHASLKAAYDSRGATAGALVTLTSSSSAANHLQVHNTLHTEHNTLGESPTLPDSPTGGHVGHHEALHLAQNLRMPVTSGLRGWWEADSITSPPADGGSLTTWNDLSGNGKDFTQATSGLKPVYRNAGGFLPNGYPCVEFVSANPSRMQATSFNNFGATTRVIIWRPKTAGTVQTLAGSSNGFEVKVESNNNLDVDVPNVAAMSFTGTRVVPVDVWHTLIFTSDGTTSHQLYVDALTAGTNATNVSAANATTLNVGSRPDGTQPASGYMAAILDYSRVLSASELTQINDWASYKYLSRLSVFRDFDFDDSETQAFTHGASAFVYNAAHQKAWVTNRTRLGAGHAERFEVHNDVNDRYSGGTERFRARMRVSDVNNGATTTATVTGYKNIYWCASFYLPSSGASDADATLVSGFSQVQGPDYEHLLTTSDFSYEWPSEIVSDVGSTHAFLIRDGDLEYRQRCGYTFWNGSSYTRPSWSTGTPGATGSNDRIKVPITGNGVGSYVFPMDTWVDIILHIVYPSDPISTSGLVEIWARRAGQSFTGSPQLSWSGPTYMVADHQTGTRYTTADPSTTEAGCGGTYLQVGWYTGSSSWGDPNNGAHVMVVDELRRWGTEAEAKLNWG